MLFYIKRPDNLVDRGPVFTRFGGLSENLARCTARAERCFGRVYSTDGHNTRLVADFYVEPISSPKLVGREYWAARNQVACFG